MGHIVGPLTSFEAPTGAQSLPNSLSGEARFSMAAGQDVSESFPESLRVEHFRQNQSDTTFPSLNKTANYGSGRQSVAAGGHNVPSLPKEILIPDPRYLNLTWLQQYSGLKKIVKIKQQRRFLWPVLLLIRVPSP